MQFNPTTLEFTLETNDEAYVALYHTSSSALKTLVREAQELFLDALTNSAPGVDENTPAAILAIQGVMRPRLALAALRWVGVNGLPTAPSP